MSRNGRRSPARPRIELRQASATPEEAAAIAAAIEQFLRNTAPAPVRGGPGVSHWLRSSLLEGVGLDATDAAPWSDPVVWAAPAQPGPAQIP